MPSREEELEHIYELLRQDLENDEEIETYYAELTAGLLAFIESFYGRNSGSDGMTLEQARLPASKEEIDQFERKARRFLEQDPIDLESYAERLESGREQRPSADSLLTERAQREVRKTDINSRSSKLEVLNANMRLEAIATTSDTQLLLDGNLNNRVLLEVHRQYQLLDSPGQLGIEQPSTMEDRMKPIELPGTERQLALPEGAPVLKIEERVSTIAHKPFHGRRWSTRLWSDQEALAQELERLIQSGISNGLNPRQLARELRESIDTSVYNSERLLRTELGKAQMETQKESYEQAGVEKYIIVVEPGACDDCVEFEGKVFNVKDMEVSVNAPVFHPNCRCSTAAYTDSESSTGLAANEDNNDNDDESLTFVENIEQDDIPEAVQNYENSIRSESVENVFVVQSDGEVYHKKGETANVSFTDDELKQMKDAVVTHNHPSDVTGWSFSKDDIQLYVETEMKELRATDEQFTYSLSGNSQIDVENLTGAYEEARFEALDYISQQGYSFDEIDLYYQHEIISILSKKAGITYRRWENE